MPPNTSEQSYDPIYPRRQDSATHNNDVLPHFYPNFGSGQVAQHGSYTGPPHFPGQPSIAAGLVQGSTLQQDQQYNRGSLNDPRQHGPPPTSLADSVPRTDGEVHVNTPGADHPLPGPARGPSDTRPYAEHILDCLMSTAPAYEMELTKIYVWFKTRTGKTRGAQRESQWQNSVRHNLSMNAAFQRGHRTPAAREKKNVWHLSDEAIAGGNIRPTTAHRKKKPRSSASSRPSAAKRAAGAKGGRSSKRGRRSTAVASGAPEAPAPPRTEHPQPVSQPPFQGLEPPDSSLAPPAPFQPGDFTSAAEPLDASRAQLIPYTAGYGMPVQAPQGASLHNAYGNTFHMHPQQYGNPYSLPAMVPSSQQLVTIAPCPTASGTASHRSLNVFDPWGHWHRQMIPPENHPYPQWPTSTPAQDGAAVPYSSGNLALPGPPAVVPPYSQHEPSDYMDPSYPGFAEFPDLDPYFDPNQQFDPNSG